MMVLVDQIFRRMAFNVMARNCDDHTKNFGFILRQGRPWNLAPAYDVTHAYNPKGEWTYQHQMSVNQKFEDISKEDLLKVADRFSVRKPENALSDVRAAIDNWPQFAKQAHLSAALQNRVANQLHSALARKPIQTIGAIPVEGCAGRHRHDNAGLCAGRRQPGSCYPSSKLSM